MNTIYVIEAEDMRLCHLGDLGQKELTPEQGDPVVVRESLGNVVGVGRDQPVFLFLQDLAALGRVLLHLLLLEPVTDDLRFPVGVVAGGAL